MRKYKIALLSLAVATLAPVFAQDGEKMFYKLDGKGELIRPTGYRSWVYVGTPITPNDMNNGKAAFPEIHSVYIDPVSYKYWKENGAWREGTILVKELIDVGSKAASSGNGYFAGEFIGLEATIKSKKDFADEPGNWAYFSFTNPTEGTLKSTAKAFAAKDCNSCHDGSAADDFVFTQYYPVLSAAKAVGGGVNPENAARRVKPNNPVDEAKVGKWDPSAPTPMDMDFGIPLDKEKLFAYLKAGGYKGFPTKETEMHPSRGPHQQLGLPVQVYMNDVISKSLVAGNEEHPKGSIIVKEMFTANKAPYGWAAMVKTQDKTEDGKGWFWYELTDENDSSKIAAMGNGVQGCFKCHSSGEDMVVTEFPVK